MVSKTDVKDTIICIIGLGYVGLPLAEEFSKHFKVIGFDINKRKIESLRKLYPAFEITSDPLKIKEGDIDIIAVPTPVTKSQQPDLYPVISASEIVGRNLKKGAIVVLESTVYPGVSEEIMGPILEKESGLHIGVDFKIGYSPERVNPGDKEHTIDKIKKIVSGMDQESAEILSEVYGKITTVYPAQSIKIAEAAKVIENIQRDLNIALMNELSLIFYKMNLDTQAVLDAASTKWNFIRFSPGLVGGHCIPVDPYYLVYKANELGYHAQVILAGRAINDYMPRHIAHLTIKSLNEANKIIKGSKVLIMGLTFKENVDDTRETPVREIIKELKEFQCDLYGHDPMIGKEEVEKFGIKNVDDLHNIHVDCIIVTVVHDIFKTMPLDSLIGLMKTNPILIDVRGYYDEAAKRRDLIYKKL
jgi:UDP-N-acetyl-D-galactosamine dehydrogenase